MFASRTLDDCKPLQVRIGRRAVRVVAAPGRFAFAARTGNNRPLFRLAVAYGGAVWRMVKTDRSGGSSFRGKP